MKNANQTSSSPDIERSKLTYFIICIIGFTQGVIELSRLAINYLFKDDFSLDPYQMSLILGVTSIPWVIKPLWGFTSDSFPMMGFRRKSYLVFLSFVQTGLWLVMTFWADNVFLAALILLMIELCNAFCNVIGEAILVEISRDAGADAPEEEKQTAASHNVSLFFGVRYIGVFITAYLSGFLLEYIDKKKIFLITASFPMILCLSSFFLAEKKFKKTPQKHLEALHFEEGEYLREGQKEEEAHESSHMEGEKCQCRNCLRLWDVVKKKEILKPILFLMAFNMIPSTASPMFFFFTTVLNFSPEFMGQLRVINALASVVAILIYRLFLKMVNFKKIFFCTSLLCILSQFLILTLITRYNLVLGIPDKVFSICDNLFIDMMSELNMIPVLVFACRICPKNVEGTMYALVMSALNLGSILSEQTGALTVFILGITSTDFTNLWLLVVIVNIFIVSLLPFLSCLNITEAQEITDWKSDDTGIEEKEQSQKEKVEPNENGEMESQTLIENNQAININEIQKKVL